MKIIPTLILFFIVSTFSGCSGPTDGFIGTWLRTSKTGEQVTLKITGDTITSSDGNMSFMATYSVLKKDGNVTEISLTAQGLPPNKTITLNEDGETLVIDNRGVFGGSWKRK